MEDRQALITAIKNHYKADVLSAKGGFFVKGVGFITLAKSRKVTGIKSIVQRIPRTGNYGDYAIMCNIVGRV